MHGHVLFTDNSDACEWVTLSDFDLFSSHSGVATPADAQAPAEIDLGTQESEMNCMFACWQDANCAAYSYYSATVTDTAWQSVCMGTSDTQHTLTRNDGVASAYCVTNPCTGI